MFALHPEVKANAQVFSPKMEAQVGQTREGFPIYADGPRDFGEKPNSIKGPEKVSRHLAEVSRHLRSSRWFTDAWSFVFTNIILGAPLVHRQCGFAC